MFTDGKGVFPRDKPTGTLANAKQDETESLRIVELSDTIQSQLAEIARLKREIQDRDKDVEGLKSQVGIEYTKRKEIYTLFSTFTVFSSSVLLFIHFKWEFTCATLILFLLWVSFIISCLILI